MIKLPNLFEQILMKSPLLAADVRKSFDLFEPWLEQSGMPFFPGFTDHSPRHINDVLNTAASLISDSGQELLSAEDVAVLCISVLLHDCGMHLTQDGFRALIEGFDVPKIAGLGDLPWHQIWNDFLSEAHRFGEEKLIAVFGDDAPFQIDDFDINNLNERDYLLIGEFVRRHHARLAHEIARAGVPSKSKIRLELVGFDDEIKDLGGLVARSHGMSIRSTFGYINDNYGLVSEFRKIHAPYLMAVLRIADYVQVKSERAIKSLLSVKELRRPISRQEWSNHFAVRDVSVQHNDPEAFYVHALPSDVRTFLRLELLFHDIQRELDESWATIGEVYGRQGSLAGLGLTIRRIRSNLDAKEKFAQTVSYVPINAGFDSSGPDLLKLLVGPLYDYKFSVGIRELIQNAVDACREHADLNRDTKTIKTEKVSLAKVLVCINESEDGTGWISVEDSGVGMTLDTVTKYFLIAGASFRNSDIWKRQHLDETGQARIIRGGRFGVGALAAFLLGSEIRVRTRHCDRLESQGLEFHARMDEPIVELRRCIAGQGTKIEVFVADPDVFDVLRPSLPYGKRESKGEIALEVWPEVDWFAQKIPEVTYQWSGYNKGIKDEYPAGKRKLFNATFKPRQSSLVPTDASDLNAWRLLPDSASYKSIHWRYKDETLKNNDEEYEIYPFDEITVNGIRVEKIFPNSEIAYLKISPNQARTGPLFSIQRPSLAISDPSGICPINLQRSSVSFERMGFDEKLAKAILTDHFKSFSEKANLTGDLDKFMETIKLIKSAPGVSYPGQLGPLCATSDGIFLATPPLFADEKIRFVFFVELTSESQNLPLKEILLPGEALMLRHEQIGIQAALAWFRSIFTVDPTIAYSSSAQAGFPRLKAINQFSLMPLASWDFAKTPGRINKVILQQLDVQPHGALHVAVRPYTAKNDIEIRKRVAMLFKALPEGSAVSAWELGKFSSARSEAAMLYETWTGTLGKKIKWE